MLARQLQMLGSAEMRVGTNVLGRPNKTSNAPVSGLPNLMRSSPNTQNEKAFGMAAGR
jgi:hypothetical protein